MPICCLFFHQRKIHYNAINDIDESGKINNIFGQNIKTDDEYMKTIILKLTSKKGTSMPKNQTKEKTTFFFSASFLMVLTTTNEIGVLGYNPLQKNKKITSLFYVGINE